MAITKLVNELQPNSSHVTVSHSLWWSPAVARRFPRLPSDQDDLAVCVDLDPLHLNPSSGRRAQRARHILLPKVQRPRVL